MLSEVTYFHRYDSWNTLVKEWATAIVACVQEDHSLWEAAFPLPGLWWPCIWPLCLGSCLSLCWIALFSYPAPLNPSPLPWNSVHTYIFFRWLTALSISKLASLPTPLLPPKGSHSLVFSPVPWSGIALNLSISKVGHERRPPILPPTCARLLPGMC